MADNSILKDELIMCPIAEKKIEVVDCLETVDGLIREEWKKPNWEEICKNCKYHYY
jgi:hypothetical protein